MYNSEKKADNYAPMSPRISFSNDFAESTYQMKQETRSIPAVAAAAASSDFEFSVSNHSMLPTMSGADELFCKGKILPFKENQRTLREELDEEEDGGGGGGGGGNIFRMRPRKGSSSSRWKGFLGFKKSHIGSKQMEKINEEKIQDIINKQD